jgi:hypothetical protein
VADYIEALEKDKKDRVVSDITLNDLTDVCCLVSPGPCSYSIGVHVQQAFVLVGCLPRYGTSRWLANRRNGQSTVSASANGHPTQPFAKALSSLFKRAEQPLDFALCWARFRAAFEDNEVCYAAIAWLAIGTWLSSSLCLTFCLACSTMSAGARSTYST